MANIHDAPYYDRYDSTKQYTQLLAVPGRVAQAREITEIQSTMKGIVKSLGDSIMKDGNIIEGCQVIVNSNNTVTVTSGRVYLSGMVLPVQESTVPIKGVGTETVGVKLNETIITEDQDSSLRDPAQGYDNFGQAGCHRVRSEVEVVIDDTNSAILTTLIDGAVSVEQYAPNYDTLTQTLARRTYDESGSYLVSGLNVRVEEHQTDPDNLVNVVVEAGKAYVLGYELKIPSARRIEIPRSLTYRAVTQRFTYSEGDTYILERSPYVESIKKIEGISQSVIENTQRGNTSSDTFPVPEVSSIVRVYQETADGEVIEYKDYTLSKSGDRFSIIWSVGGNSPTPGSSYNLVYNYYKDYEEGEDKDYKLTHNLETDAHEVEWVGDHPLSGTDFTVDYNLYLSREDVVYIDQFGNIEVILGTPAGYGYTAAPDSPVNTLPLAQITNPPAGTADYSKAESVQIIVENIGLTRFTMNDIQRLLNRINTISYDQTVLSLNNVAKEYSTDTAKKGIFTDPLLDLSRIDLYYNKNGIKYDANIDVDDNICFLPIDSYVHDLVYAKELQYKDSSNNDQVHYSTVEKSDLGRTATLATSTEKKIVLSQMNATGSFQINPYQQFPQSPEIFATPAVDVWIEDSIITVPISRTTKEVVSTSTRNTSSTSVRGGSFSSYYKTSQSTKDTQIGTTVEVISSSESVVSEQAITYIRPREITITGSYFPPNLGKIKGYFDGIKVALVPTNGTEADEDGSIKANSNGEFSCSFKIPEKVLTGIREIRLASEEKPEIGYYETEAFTLYQASGTRRTIQKTVETLTTILLERVTTVHTTKIVDPVGQTFVLDNMTMIRGLDLYFRHKPNSGDYAAPVTCEIRGVSNGTIDSTVHGHKTLPWEDILVSEDSKTATSFVFDDPVLLEANKEYAFVVKSTSPNYSVWIAELGGTKVGTENELVTSNPYLVGVMLSSSNNSSWTTHQTMDVKFRLVADVYEPISEVYFSNVSVGNLKKFSRALLAADSLIPNGTSVDWLYTLDGGNTYNSISPYDILLLNNLQHSIGIKAVLRRGENTSLSPVIALDAVSLILSHYDPEGVYISKNLTGFDEFETVTVILDTYEPSSTSISVSISTDDGQTLREATSGEIKHGTPNMYGWKESTYQFKSVSRGADSCKLFIKMNGIREKISRDGEEEDYASYVTPSFRRVRVIMS